MIYYEHKIASRNATIGKLFAEEQKALSPLPICKFETAKSIDARISAYSTVRFQVNDYSLPVKYVGYTVGVKGYPDQVEILSNNEIIASHTRSYGKNEKVRRLIDYTLLNERGRAVLDALPVKKNLSEKEFVDLRANIGNRDKCGKSFIGQQACRIRRLKRQKRKGRKSLSKNPQQSRM